MDKTEFETKFPGFSAVWRAVWSADVRELATMPEDQLDLLLTIMEKTTDAVAEEVGRRTHSQFVTDIERELNEYEGGAA